MCAGIALSIVILFDWSMSNNTAKFAYPKYMSYNLIMSISNFIIRIGWTNH